MNNRPYVYKLTHVETGEFYFGYRRANKKPAIDDLGKEYFTSSKFVRPNFASFNTEIIEEFNNPDEAFWAEQRLIEENSQNPLILNRKFQRQNTKVWVFCGHQTDSAKQKISEKLRGRKHSPEHAAKIGEALRGRKYSQEALEKRNKPKPFSEETRLKMSRAKKGKKQSSELIAKRVAKNKGKKRYNPCTIDGITVFNSLKEMRSALGQGKNGTGSPHFRFINVISSS